MKSNNSNNSMHRWRYWGITMVVRKVACVVVVLQTFSCGSRKDVQGFIVQHPVVTTTQHAFGFHSQQQGRLISTQLHAKGSKVSSQKSLYDILESPPDAKRMDLKKQYIKLAKTLHPDASISSNDNNNNNNNNTTTTFTDVAMAWKVLSDPLERKRYDRTLAALAFTSDVEKVADQFGKTTAPYVKQAFKNLAMPLIRRTSATTTAVITAATEDLSFQTNSNNNNTTKLELDWQQTIRSVFKAGIDAGKSINRLELMEKCRELEKRANDESQAAVNMKDRLHHITKERLHLALHISNAPFTADEATSVLHNLNTTDSLTLLDRTLLMKHTVQFEIDSLRDVEKRYTQKLKLDSLVQQEFAQKEANLTYAERRTMEAVDKVERAKLALMEAQVDVIKVKQELSECTRNVTAMELIRKRSEADVTKLNISLERRRRLVRNALMKKEEEESAYETTTNTNKEPTMEDFQTLVNEEKYLRTETLRLEDRAKRFRSRSQKLKKEADILKELQN